MTNHLPHNLSLRIKALGFDRLTDYYYDNDGNMMPISITAFPIDRLKCPTYAEFFDWCREEKKLFGVVLPIDDWNSWGFQILAEDSMSPFFVMFDALRDGNEYPTHQSAEQALAIKLVEILEQQKK